MMLFMFWIIRKFIKDNSSIFGTKEFFMGYMILINFCFSFLFLESCRMIAKNTMMTKSRQSSEDLEDSLMLSLDKFCTSSFLK